MTRILLADDHPMIRTAIEVLLRDTDYVIAATAGSGDEALRLVDQIGPDVLLLDLQMPGGSGMGVVRALHSKANAPKIVILTAAIDDASLMEARALGVAGMVLKNSDPAYLLDCLDGIRTSSSWLDPELGARMEDLDKTYAESPRPALTPRERQVIQFVSQGLRNREIAKSLGVTEGTVKVYLHGVFDKVGVSSRTELAIRAGEFLAESYARR